MLGFIYYLEVFSEFDDMAILFECMWYSAVMFYVWDILCMSISGELFEDVTFISYLFIIIDVSLN